MRESGGRHDTVGDEKDNTLFVSEKRESTVDQVINSIKEALITEKLRPGDRLPSETDLSNQLSVSRGSIREAMKILSAFGIVEIRRGDGTYIARSDHKVIFDPLLFSLILSRAKIREMVELRELMEFAIVKLVIQNASTKEMSDLEHALEDMDHRIRENVNNSPEELAESDLRFHRALGRAAKNILAQKIYDFVMDFFAPSITKTHKNQGNGIKALSQHRNIYRALADRNMGAAIDAVEESIILWKTLSMGDQGTG
jgi:GntR family transcriptional repressor for pyruvate dehydrogenase complex